MARQIKNIPKADHLMGSMRSMGYTFESAIADILDNSISANCRNIQLYFPNKPIENSVSILDDGDGMSNEELFNAMRYGSTASETERTISDLGRFGLGLKAASLSQCRVLTVVSKKEGELSAYRWDYGYILKNKEWYILKLQDSDIDSIPHVDDLKAIAHGTLVVWTDFDIIEKSSNGQLYITLCEYKDKVSKYIALIFHRYLDARKSNGITIKLNNHQIVPLDPFLENHNKTKTEREADIALKDSNGVERHIKARPFVLPYFKDLSTKDIDKLGGLESLRTKQGFYVYRNERLIIWGTWFGMHASDELTKNARIRVDIPNTLDDIWKLDIKKQNASIPKSIQNQLKRKVEETMDFSVRQQTHRGRKSNVNEHIDYLWNRLEGRDNTFYYEINRKNRLVEFIKSQISDESTPYLDMLLEEIENSIPIQQIYIDQSRNSIVERDDEEDRLNEIFQKAVLMVNYGIQLTDAKTVIDNLFLSEPFCSHNEIKERLYKHFQL